MAKVHKGMSQSYKLRQANKDARAPRRAALKLAKELINRFSDKAIGEQRQAVTLITKKIFSQYPDVCQKFLEDGQFPTNRWFKNLVKSLKNGSASKGNAFRDIFEVRGDIK